MAGNNKLELVIEIDPSKANAAIKGINTGLSSIEQAAVKGATGASAGMDRFTASMVKGATAGNLIADAITNAINVAKEWTIEAAKMAAHEQRMETSSRALAKAHGIATDEFERSVEAIKDVGFLTEDAVHAVDRLIIADLELSKGKGLAQIAKDAAAIENIGAPEALEKLLQSIEFGNARALRAAGLRVNFEDEITRRELQLGRALTENEKVQIRYNAVVQAAAAIQGAHAASAGDAEGQMKALAREVTELKEAVGGAFQDELKWVVARFRDMAGWLRENTDLMVKLAEVALSVAAAFATYAAVTKTVNGLTGAIKALNLAMTANPYTLVAMGVVAAGAILYKEQSDMRAGMERSMMQSRNDEIRRIAASRGGMAKLSASKEQGGWGLTDEDIREALTGQRVLDTGLGLQTGIKIASQPSIEDLKAAAEVRKRQRENEKFFAERAIGAAGAGVTGPAKDFAEMQAAIAQRTSFVDDGGVSHTISLTKKAWESVIQELDLKLGAFKEKTAKDQRGLTQEYFKDWTEVTDKRQQLEERLLEQRYANEAQIAQRNLDHIADLYNIQDQRAGQARDRELRGLDGTDAQTIQQKVWVEQRKADIEIEYLRKTNEVKMSLFDMETRRQVMEEELTMQRLGYRADQIKARLDELNKQRSVIRDANQAGTDEAIAAAQQNAANRQTQIVREHFRSVYESLKQQAGGVFDALLQKSQSVWAAIGNSFKTAMLTAIKEVVTSRVAAMLMQLFTGQRTTFASGGGVLGGLGIGLAPVFGGSGGIFGSGPVGGNPTAISAIGGGSGSAPRAGGGLLGMGGLAGSMAGLKSFPGFGGGSVQIAPGVATTWAASTIGQKLSALGRSNAALLGGSILAMDGLRRGGWAGLGETTAGGALIGFKFGGPLGAAVGAGVGAIAGTIRMFIKGAQEKAREKIKATYDVDISDKGTLKQIVDMAKQGFGGNLDVAIRSQAVRDLIELYAMTTGQPTKGLGPTIQPLSLAQSGGSLYQAPGCSNGAALPSMAGMPALGGIGAGVASGGGLGSTVVNLQIDSTSVGSVVLRGGRVVAQSLTAAMKSNVGRRDLAALQMSPGLVTG
jgi:hypothetical protein